MAIAFCGKRIILTRKIIYKTQKRKNGYIILLPEIGEDLPDKDPLLKANGFPEFNTFSIERATAAVGKLSVLFEQGIQKIEENIEEKNDVDVINDVLNPIEELNLPFETTWGIVQTLFFGNQSLMPIKHYENIHRRMQDSRAEKYVSRPVYRACRDALRNPDLNVTSEQRRMLERYALAGRLNGLEIKSARGQNRFADLNFRIFQKGNEIKEKIEIATSMFQSKITNPNTVRDFPEDFLRVIASNPKNPHQGPWNITLEDHVIRPFLKYCPDRNLRMIAWRALRTRGALASESTLRTSSNLEDIRDFKMKRAEELGYKSSAQMSMETKMAGNVDTVYEVMDNLLKAARPVQEKEIKELMSFAHDRGFIDKIIRPWDVSYWMRKHRRSVLNFKDEIVHQYFPLPQVLNGLFQLVENLFDIRIVEGRKTDVWHTDVRFFDVIDLKSTDNEPIAHFYIDPYARGTNKMTRSANASAMVAIRGKSKIVGTKPLTAIILTFRPPVGDVPSLLSFEDVEILFKEFGRTLEQLLTCVTYSEFTASATVEWDAGHVCSYFLRNWLYEPDVIRSIATHYKTNEPIPDELIESIGKIKSHMIGYKLCDSLYEARFDLELHDSEEFWIPMMQRLWKRHYVIPYDEYDSHITSWTEIFSDQYGAAVYGFLWSEMLAADVYSAFKELPKGDSHQMKETGMRFRDTYLALGGSVPAAEVFRRFRGRDPNYGVLLESAGLQLKTNDVVR